MANDGGPRGLFRKCHCGNKQRGMSVPAGTRRKDLIEMLKKAANTQANSTMLDGPHPMEGGAPLDGAASMDEQFPELSTALGSA